MPRRRIDVHHHIVPPAYVAWLASAGVSDAGGRALPAWSVDEALTLMESHDVATAIVSLSLAFAKPGHVLFGSDWPFAPSIAVAYFAAQLDAYAGLDADGHAAIDRGSAEGLFPALADKETA